MNHEVPDLDKEQPARRTISRELFMSIELAKDLKTSKEALEKNRAALKEAMDTKAPDADQRPLAHEVKLTNLHVNALEDAQDALTRSLGEIEPAQGQLRVRGSFLLSKLRLIDEQITAAKNGGQKHIAEKLEEERLKFEDQLEAVNEAGKIVEHYGKQRT